MFNIEYIALLGFLLAAYSIVANDAIQTLGTFLSSNAHRPWWVLWLFVCSVLTVVMVWAWTQHGGDVAYGRLSKFPEPEVGIQWWHAIPPVIILILTRFGIPVSTTFLVLTVFAPINLAPMVTKSLLGYLIAFGVGIVVFRFVTHEIEARFREKPADRSRKFWVVAQWGSTAFLWSQWLTHDLANIFVYMPRTLTLTHLLFALGALYVLHAYLLMNRGGTIQKIVLSKTNTTDIRSATIIDLIYGLVLFVFKEMNNIPMSTTWVFLGLLGGRELAIAWFEQHRSFRESFQLVATDGAKAAAGLGISIVLALTLPEIMSK